MDTSRLKKFAQYARRSLIEQVHSKLRFVLADDSAARREQPRVVKELEDRKEQLGEKELIEQVAYTWFNRFCALRFMDVNQYNRIMVVSPIAGQFQPEILAEAKAGHLDDSVFNGKALEKVQGLLSGNVPSRDGQAEAYRLMIVAMCNDYYRLMPYLFERIQDYTELLMPDDLLSGNSILAYTREAMTAENCESVESIGWLYQFYISEKKDQVFEGLKKNIKITPENIPAATQLFTPHWIVRYLVENSLGRLWMLNNPNSKVIEQMNYYIKPVGEEIDFLRVNSPEELKICDPACGSGHILIYAYDLLYAIYLDANYDPIDIPELIITKNLYGIEIDERAAELAAFALSMKALKGNPNDVSNNRRRFFRNPIKPNVCRLENVKIDEDALGEYIEFIGRDLFTQDLSVTLKEFEEADNFGSLIKPTLTDVEDVLAIIEAKDAQVDFFLADTHKSVLRILKQVEYLSPKYHAVIANPPYMGKKNMNARLQSWIGSNYPISSADFYSAFIERNLEFTAKGGLVSMITMDSWMSGDEYTLFRNELLENVNISNLIHLGAHAFEEIKGEVVQVAAYTFCKSLNKSYTSVFHDLTIEGNHVDKEQAFLGRKNKYLVDKSTFENLPRNVIAYFITEHSRNAFDNGIALKHISEAFTGLQTGDNDKFMRRWFEVQHNDICFYQEDSNNRNQGRWYPYVKGSDFRKWYGNNEFVLDWRNNGRDIKNHKSSTLRNEKYYLKSGIAYNNISNKLSTRFVEDGFIFDQKNSMFFSETEENLYFTMAFLHSKIVLPLLRVIAPKDFGPGSMKLLPVMKDYKKHYQVNNLSKQAIELTHQDWDEFELSWNFESLPILKYAKKGVTFENALCALFKNNTHKVEQVKKIEESINEIFINAYGLDSELKPDVSKENITLFSNPTYKYGKQNNNDYITEFFSYCVACTFGRYAIDKKALILSNQGDSLESYLSQIPSPSFMPDEDNVIPIIDFELEKDKDEYWFEDDISERFKAFLKVTFGVENFAENLRFIEKTMGKDIKKYFVRDFYADHVKLYKKRPIYWLFSSVKGSFNALIYMHRYQPDTASIVLNDYLREFRTKLEARKDSYEQVEVSVTASQKDKTQAIKSIAKINKVLEEINDYEHDVLYPLAGQNIEIDLDDGVKHNYPLFGNALKKVTGLS